MKLGPVTKFNKKKKHSHVKKIDDDVMLEIVTSLSFFQFTANLEQSRNCIPNAWSAKLTVSLTVTFYLTKTENKIK